MSPAAEALARFYDLLGELEASLGRRLLSRCTSASGWATRGVYFFFEPDERRASGGLRVVRVGTHALSATSRATLWTRLGQHRGTGTGGGNHRGSVFRKLVGQALLQREGLQVPTWGVGSSSSSGNRFEEAPIERKVSQWLGQTSVLWLPVDDPPGPDSLRAVVERNSIALLSNRLQPLDPPSPDWLGRWCPDARVQRSGLWNCNHVEQSFVPGFLRQMKALLPTAYGASAEQASLAADRPRAESLMDRVRAGTRAGDVVRTVRQGRTNTIVAVDDEKLTVRTDRSTQEVPWEWVRAAVEEFCRRGTLEQDQIPGKGRYRSAFLFALLADKLEEFREMLKP